MLGFFFLSDDEVSGSGRTCNNPICLIFGREIEKFLAVEKGFLVELFHIA